MPILRANSSFIHRLTTGEFTATGYSVQGVNPAPTRQIINPSTGAITNEPCGQPSEAHIIERGLLFRNRLSEATLSYTPSTPPFAKSVVALGNSPGVRVEINLSHLPGVPLIFANGNFEADIPTGARGADAMNKLTALGWTVVASPVDSAMPAAQNPSLGV